MYTLHQIGLNFCALRRLKLFFFSLLGREAEEGRRRRRLSSEITASMSAIVHLFKVIIMYTIYEVLKFLECRGSWWCKEVNQRCFCYHQMKWVQHHLYRTGSVHASASNLIFSPARILNNCSCLIEQQSRTIAVIWLSCACKHTDWSHSEDLTVSINDRFTVRRQRSDRRHHRRVLFTLTWLRNRSVLLLYSNINNIQ